MTSDPVTLIEPLPEDEPATPEWLNTTDDDEGEDDPSLDEEE